MFYWLKQLFKREPRLSQEDLKYLLMYMRLLRYNYLRRAEQMKSDSEGKRSTIKHLLRVKSLISKLEELECFCG